MIKIGMADLIIQIDNKYGEIISFCDKYLVENSVAEDFIVFTTPQENERSKLWYRKYENMELTDDIAERDQMQHKIYPELPVYDAFWLHACVVAVDGEAYAFTAPSGTGKTTHVLLWKRLFGEKASIINGDNPIIRLRDGGFYAYGTPWCGKEGWSENKGVPLKGVCYINQAFENELIGLSPIEAFYRILQFSCVYQRKDNIDQMMLLYENLVEKVPFYQMNCNMELEAARISYEGMSGKRCPAW